MTNNTGGASIGKKPLSVPSRSGRLSEKVQRYGMCMFGVAPVVLYSRYFIAMYNAGELLTGNLILSNVAGIIVAAVVGIWAASVKSATPATTLAWNMLGASIGLFMVVAPEIPGLVLTPADMGVDGSIPVCAGVCIVGVVLALWLKTVLENPQVGELTASGAKPDDKKLLEAIGDGAGMFTYIASRTLPALVFYSFISYAIQILWFEDALSVEAVISGISDIVPPMVMVGVVIGTALYLQLVRGDTRTESITAILHILLVSCVIKSTILIVLAFAGSRYVSAWDCINRFVLAPENCTVMAVLLVLWVVVTLAVQSKAGEANRHCEVTVAVVALAGLGCVVKAAVANSFIVSMIVVIPYMIAVAVIAERSAHRSYDKKVPKGVPPYAYHLLCVAAVTAVCCAVAVAAAYSYFLLILVAIVGCVILRIARNTTAKGIHEEWIREGVLWQILLCIVVAAACAVSVHRAWSMNTAVLLGVIVLFASVAMWVMVFHDRLGDNNSLPYRVVKISTAVVVAVVSMVMAVQGAPHVSLKLSEPEDDIDRVVVTVTVEDMDHISSLSYAWSDTPVVDESTITQVAMDQIGDDGTVSVPMDKQHLTLWLESDNGTRTRIDRWYAADGDTLYYFWSFATPLENFDV